jgi:hypothetical protein
MFQTGVSSPENAQEAHFATNRPLFSNRDYSNAIPERMDLIDQHRPRRSNNIHSAPSIVPLPLPPSCNLLPLYIPQSLAARSTLDASAKFKPQLSSKVTPSSGSCHPSKQAPPPRYYLSDCSPSPSFHHSYHINQQGASKAASRVEVEDDENEFQEEKHASAPSPPPTIEDPSPLRSTLNYHPGSPDGSSYPTSSVTWMDPLPSLVPDVDAIRDKVEEFLLQLPLGEDADSADVEQVIHCVSSTHPSPPVTSDANVLISPAGS